MILANDNIEMHRFTLYFADRTLARRGHFRLSVILYIGFAWLKCLSIEFPLSYNYNRTTIIPKSTKEK